MTIGKARYISDDDAMPALAAMKDEARRLTDLERELRRDLLIGQTANAIGAKIVAGH